ncbi:MAG TPA: TOMM precursor leader peptide-binding protein, partial [Thermomicrobiales bacterium]
MVGSGPLAAEIAATIRALAPSCRVLAWDGMPEPDALVGSGFLIGVAGSDATGPLHRINRVAVSRNIPWLPIRVIADTVRFGPTVVPGATACLLCTALREAALPHPPAPFPPREGGAAPPRPSLAMERGQGGEVPTLAALEALQTLLGEPSRARGYLGLIDRESGEWTWHPVLRHPRCPVCGGLPWS